MSYWHDITGARTNRRRILAVTGMGTAAAAFLAACGGGSESKTSDAEKQSNNDRLFKPTDTSSKAVAGARSMPRPVANCRSLNRLNSRPHWDFMRCRR